VERAELVTCDMDLIAGAARDLYAVGRSMARFRCPDPAGSTAGYARPRPAG